MQNTNIKGDVKIKYAFFGTGTMAESTLYTLYKNNLSPEYIFTKPDSVVGRHKDLKEPLIKKWANSKNITVIQPERLKPSTVDLNIDDPKNNIDGYNLLKSILKDMDICIVSSYGKIIPMELLELPKYGFINIHPSDLPHFRGPSPIETQLLNAYKEIVISIMKLDVGMDTGDIIIKNKIMVDVLDTSQSLEIKCGQAGGELILKILKDYIDGNIKLIKQNVSDKSICHFIKKEDGEIKISKQEILESLPTSKLEKIKDAWRAFYPWPGIFFFLEEGDKRIRFKVTEFDLTKETFAKCVKKIIPEGKKEIAFEDFKRGYLK